MANATPSRFGAVNGGVDKDALFLKVFSGEVMAEFEQATAALDKHIIRTITSGKSASFPILGKTTAAYHTPGTEITGSSINSAEQVITINDLLLTSVFIANIDEAKSHFEVRSHYAREMGIALANQFDKHVLQTALQAAAASATLTGGNGGSTITNATADTDADALIDSIFDAAQGLDEKNVPETDRFIFVKPAQYYLLANSSKVQNVDWGNAGNGSTASGKVMEVAGIRVVKTNQLPTAAVSSGTVGAGTSDRQIVDASNTVGLVLHKSAVGTVKLMDIATEAEYDIRRQGTLMVAKYAMGHGVLRPEAAVRINAS